MLPEGFGALLKKDRTLQGAVSGAHIQFHLRDLLRATLYFNPNAPVWRYAGRVQNRSSVLEGT